MVTITLLPPLVILDYAKGYGAKYMMLKYSGYLVQRHILKRRYFLRVLESLPRCRRRVRLASEVVQTHINFILRIWHFRHQMRMMICSTFLRRDDQLDPTLVRLGAAFFGKEGKLFWCGEGCAR